MTTPNEELIARLRDRATFLGPELTLAILPEAADLLQSQAERIKELESECLNTDVRLATAIEQREQMRAAIAATEPEELQYRTWYGEPDNGWSAWRRLAHCDTENVGRKVEAGTAQIRKLYTHPMPAESKDAERYRWLRDYLISPSTHFDDLIVSADKADTLNGVIDAAIAKGAK